MERIKEQLLNELKDNTAGVCFKVIAGANYDKFKAAKALAEQGVVSMDQRGATIYVWKKT